MTNLRTVMLPMGSLLASVQVKVRFWNSRTSEYVSLRPEMTADCGTLSLHYSYQMFLVLFK